MLSLLSSFIAIVAGGFLWLVIGILSKNSSRVDEAPFWLPILLVVLPCAMAAVSRGFVATGIWLAAVAPVLGVVGSLFVAAIAGDNNTDIVAYVVWSLLFLLTVFLLRRNINLKNKR